MKIGFHSSFVVFLYMVVWFGLANLLALRFRGHTFSEAWLSMFGNTA